MFRPSFKPRILCRRIGRQRNLRGVQRRFRSSKLAAASQQPAEPSSSATHDTSPNTQDVGVWRSQVTGGAAAAIAALDAEAATFARRPGSLNDDFVLWGLRTEKEQVTGTHNWWATECADQAARRAAAMQEEALEQEEIIEDDDTGAGASAEAGASTRADDSTDGVVGESEGAEAIADPESTDATAPSDENAEVQQPLEPAEDPCVLHWEKTLQDKQLTVEDIKAGAKLAYEKVAELFVHGENFDNYTDIVTDDVAHRLNACLDDYDSHGLIPLLECDQVETKICFVGVAPANMELALDFVFPPFAERPPKEEFGTVEHLLWQGYWTFFHEPHQYMHWAYCKHLGIPAGFDALSGDIDQRPGEGLVLDVVVEISARGTFGLLQEEGHDDPSAEMVVNLQEMWKNAGATTQTGPNEDAPNAKDKAAAQETAPDGENDEAEADAKDADAVDGEDEEVEEEEKMAIEVGEWEIHPQVWTFSCPLDEIQGSSARDNLSWFQSTTTLKDWNSVPLRPRANFKVSNINSVVPHWWANGDPFAWTR